MPITSRIQVLVLFMLFTVLCAGCTAKQYEPEDGIWYCEELEMQLSYDKDGQSYVVENGEKIICACGSDKGVPYLFVSIQEVHHSSYSLGEEIFCAKIISVSETEFVVYDENNERQYIFSRIDSHTDNILPFE